MKRFKVRQDIAKGVWYVMKKELNQNSEWRWFIITECKTQEEAVKVRKELEKEKVS